MHANNATCVLSMQSARHATSECAPRKHAIARSPAVLLASFVDILALFAVGNARKRTASMENERGVLRMRAGDAVLRGACGARDGGC